ncbi:MAG: Hit-like protein involved in cell-cycle regulation [Bacteroidetes bacterium]|nr:MAG: Hit-like protein involved in cell-cycle regulation [Bacteroidota bacterium]
MASIFSKIVSGEIPSHKVAETENCLAFLDVFPLTRGHVLVIPKKEINYLFDIEDELFTELHLFAKEIARSIKAAVPCMRIGVAVIGLEVPHAHIHLVPINSVGDINFAKEKLKPSKEELEATAREIREAFLSLRGSGFSPGIIGQE